MKGFFLTFVQPFQKLRLKLNGEKFELFLLKIKPHLLEDRFLKNLNPIKILVLSNYHPALNDTKIMQYL